MKPVLAPAASRLRQLPARLGEVLIWLSVLPFFVLCWFAHPSADDFLQANDVAKHGHWGYVSYLYFHWTGRYTAMLGWSFLNPVSYGHDKAGYGLVCFLLLGAMLGALVWLLRTLLRGAGLTARQLGQAGAGLLLLIAFQLPNTAEWVYWLTSAFNYLVPGILLLLALATLTLHIRQEQPARPYHLVSTAVLLVLAVGCNETIAVPVLLTTWGVVLHASRQQRRPVGWGVALAVSAGCAVAFLAPGNTARVVEEQVASPGVVGCGLRIINFGTYCLVNWLGNGVLVVVTVLLVPVFARLARRPLPLHQLVRQPLLLTLLVPAFLAAGLFPVIWVSGNVPPPRAQNLLYLCFTVNWLLAAYAWVFYFVRSAPDLALFRLPAFARWLLLAWLPLVLFTDYNHHQRDPGYRFSTNNTLLAYRDLLHGRATRYDQQLTARYRYLRSTPSADVRIDTLADRPVTIFFSDISPNKDNWDNRAYAEFFRQKSIVAEPAPPW
ncbi:DUF6056 family protein [Hymenobacter sp.]|uniref:DUF6056 family protein n=1 Tax=Hymenobacter sp. TaxID=1898978 RepID=UPI00286C568B|nr:DUF6056 family protein [Hymenobacter sp.]